MFFISISFCFEDYIVSLHSESHCFVAIILSSIFSIISIKSRLLNSLHILYGVLLYKKLGCALLISFINLCSDVTKEELILLLKVALF
jgi:hypothetical protein